MAHPAITKNRVRNPCQTDEDRWQAISARDARADGTFWYGVTSTGVYCRPQCPSRTARRENLRFFGTQAAARAAGFRPCKRCRPEAESEGGRGIEAVRRACRLIEAAESPPSLAAIAEATGFSPSHVHRLFKRLTGVTPKHYAMAHRARRVSEGLGTAGTITAALYESGFSSSGRFYEHAPAILGMTPGTYRRGGAGETIRYAVARCSLGLLLVAATRRGVCALRFGEDASALEAELAARFPEATITPGDATFTASVDAAIAHVEQPRQRLDLPLDIRGTAFQQRVWQALRAIPPGTTRSYREIAAAIGKPSAARAVAGACGANPLAVAIPCHRVIGADGDLSGYRWGLDRKAELLKREAAPSAGMT